MSTLRSRALAAAAVVAAGWLLVQPVAAADVSAAGRLNFTMQAQQQTQWCWAAAGTSIAVYHGTSVTQTRFCQLAHDESGTSCRNSQGDLGEVREAFADLGYSSPGNYLSGTIGFSSVQSQINLQQPIETRILWSSGGGHMHAVYGYEVDSANRQWVDWADPWGSNTRYNRSTYSSYRSNSSFTWTHTLTGINR
ncbi:papain-like cysteine protease family protein [Nocardia sp. NRRL S-836]|uniref:papain-like cysteine protease family protein n=1 Tax=Nocardia sp. NRRL S-836 TaxID=1519492 RepID=UPI000AB96266|nr:papain-like cysteine protease family protein [Nocardia sp. NRRL S-836]